MSDPRDVVAAKLPKSWSQDKRDTLADEILDALEEVSLLVGDALVTEVAVGERPLIPVETVEAYGLTIRLDAMGEASEISSDRGLVALV
jgi:hypothetical protein